MTLNELLPTYGDWGGPGWSAGKRTQPGETIDWTKKGTDGLDELFKAHDWAYYQAEKNPAEASQIIFDADIALMRDIASGNWDSGLYGALYAPLAELAFGAKSLWDLANIVKDRFSELFDDAESQTPDPITPQDVIEISVSTSVVNENDGMISFTVMLSSVLTQAITIDLMTLDGSAVVGEDYGTASSFTVTIPAGSTSVTFAFPVLNDNNPESTETFTVAPYSFSYSGTEQILLSNAGTGIILDDDQGATPYDDILILTDKNDIMDALAGDDYVEGQAGNDTLIGNDGDDILWGGEGSDMLYGDNGNDILSGDNGNDYLEGGTEDDLLYGGDGDDVLLGGDGSDYLNGGAGFDMYVTDKGDVVSDSDGNGAVYFENIDISGTKTKSDQGDFYEDENNTYTNAGALIVTSKSSGESITLDGWSDKDLGITLQDTEDIEVSVGDAAAFEADEMMKIDVALQRELLANETMTVDLGYYTPIYRYEATGNIITVPAGRRYDSYTGTWNVWSSYTYAETRQIQTGERFNVVGSVTFEPGDQVKTFTYTWKDDDVVGVHTGHPNPLKLTAKTNEETSHYGDDIKVIAMNSGTETIIDDDEAGRYDPLVLDTNRDGFISTTPLTTSTTYFDITGDGLRERIGWISPEDALLTYDKNDNGQIDGIDEIFGSMTESGFEELKRLIDSNYDNKIDRRDELFQRLQLWHDNNQDGRVQEGELHSLKQDGVTSIDLNYVSTRIEINGNLLTEASKYTTDGEIKELVADIQLATDVADTKVDIADIPGFTIDESTRALPGLKGSGKVYDAFIIYNTNNEFKALSEVLASDSAMAFNDFEGYLEQWSGYTKYIDQLKERYSLSDDFTMQEGDKHAWIIDRFSAKDDSTTTIQNYYNTSLNNGKIPTAAIVNDAKINTKYTALLEKTQSSFIILTQYQELFSDVHYNIATDRFIIDNNTAFNTKIDNYLNDSTKTIEEKLHLASVMQMQRQGLNFEIDTILGAINNSITKTLVRDIYSSKGVAFLASESIDNSGVLLGSEGDDVVKTTDTNAKILLGTGNDTIQSGKGHNSFFFRKGDGTDVISDGGGIDSLIFDEGINRDDVIIQLNRNSDLVIAIKEDGKTFDELTDKVTIVDWMKAANRIEEIRFGDGSQLKFKEVFALFEATDAADVLQLSTGNDTINSGGGNDVITAQMGNDTIIGGQGDDRLDGGIGNDIYIYNRGDGKDMIIDSGGYDTLQFTAGITNDDLIAKLQGTDLLIAIKEEGKTFAQLSDVITLKNYKNTKETIEAIFLEGYRRVDIQALLNAPTNENDTLVLGDTNDTIDLLAGDDTLQAGGGNDTIIGGKGNDRLEGGEGDDTYLFNRGDGKDTIYDDSSFGNNNSRKINAGNDTLRFGEGISQDDLIIQYVGSDLIIGLKEDGKEFNTLSDSVTIVNYTDANDKIENILFSDGSKVIINEIKNGTAGNDTLNFKDKTEDLVLQGLGGIDFIHGGSGNDNLQGNAGTDDIYGGAGGDTLIGGSESDFLAGGNGDDTYVFNSGDGADVILDDNRPEYESFGSTNIRVDKLLKRMELGGTTPLDAGNDTLKFGAGITREDISYAISGKDLIINIAGGSGDSITIVNYLNTKNRLENIVLDDGTTIDLFAATQGKDNLVFGDTDTTIDALGGDDIVSTGLGNDTITGGTGDDRLEGGAGDDTYIYARGDGKDTITDAAGNDTLKITGALTQDDVIVKLIGKDLIIALKEDGKSFDVLTDKITIKNHTNATNKLETILFDDGSSLDLGSFDFGTQDNDSFQFADTNTSIDAKAGDDVVSTGSGNDTITGGAGSDTLMGGAGNDTYIYARGDGKDAITDISGNDTLKFIGGLTSDDVVVKLIGRDLVVALLEDGKSFEELSDKVIFKNHTNNSNKLETIVFDDGSSINVETLDFGSVENDNLIFGSASLTIDAKEGDDIVSTGAGNDMIAGGMGNDTLNGSAGTDTLVGGLDNDVLQGGRDNDTYLFNRGDGNDTINDYYNGYSISDGSIEFDKDDANGHVVVKLTGSGLISALKNREIPFSNFATNITDTDKNSINSDDLFIKIVGDDVVIARIQSGRFEDWSNKITFHLYVSDNGIMEFGDGVVQGNLFANFVDGDLIIGTDPENQIIFHQNANAGNDTLQFGAGITKEDILYKSIGNDLVFGLKDGDKSFEELSDTITIKNYVNSNNKIENIRFNDETLFDFDSTPVATEYDDDLVFVNGDVTVDLLGGNDKVTTSSGNDTIAGGSGDDTIRSGAGRDKITGGLGNDTLDGGAGDDTYVFNRGDAKDTITDSAGHDTIEFGKDIVQSDVLFKQEDFDLRIALREEGKTFDELSDVILIKDWFKTNTNIETVKFVDNSTMSITQIASMLLSSEADTLYSNHGAVMRGGKGDDTYVYKKDDFTVIIDDQFYNKELAINAGNDTLKFEDINRDKVTIGSKGNDLIIKIEATHDTYTELKDYVVIRDWKNPNRGIESIIFGDGEVLAIDKTTTYAAIEFDENWIKGRYYIYGSENNDINGTEFSEVIESGAGDDIVKALDGNDTLNGGLGNDTLEGGKGNDTYVFNRGDGTDVIHDYEGGVDAIKFGMNISLSDVILQRVNDDLIMALSLDGKTFEELTDKITLSDWFNVETLDHRIELMVFNTEGTLAIADRVILPTINNDDLEYGDEKNHIDALAGDDIIHIGGGDDELAGNDGDDILYGEAGNDTISGDKGNDTLYGGDGDDTYRFGVGDGVDTVIEDSFANWSQTGNDTLKFKDGISPIDVILVQSGDDLIVALKENGKTFAELTDKITLKNWSLYDEVNSRDLSRAYYVVENFSFSDGTTWNMSNIIAHIGSDVGEIIHGFNQNDTLNGQEGDDTLLGYLGDDTYVFDRGNGHDTIYDYGRKGDSYYNAGVDTLKFGMGISEQDLVMVKSDDDVIVYIKNTNQTIFETTDKITIKDWFITNSRIENMTLFDGTKIDYSKYLGANPTIGNDTLIYGYNDDVVDALAGDDTVVDIGGNNIIDGNSGDDTLQSGDGADLLIGGEGNDTLNAGRGDDTLDGGAGDDTYIFNLRDGRDTIYDADGIDTLSFGEGITKEDLVFEINDTTVMLGIRENGVDFSDLSDVLMIDKTQIEKIEFADGREFNIADIILHNNAPIIVPQIVQKEQQVNSYTNGEQIQSVITALNDGGYTVVWHSFGQDGSYGGIYLQQYNSSGLKVGTEQQVNSYTNNHQSQSAITALNDGGYTVAWCSWIQDGSGYGIYLQQYNSSGLKVGTEQRVNSYTNSDQSMPAITALNDGGYTVAWRSYGQDGSGQGIYLQQYNSSGLKVGTEQRVNSYTNSDQYAQVITALNGGGYTVAWASKGQDGSGYGIYLQQYNSSGLKVGGEQRVNSYMEDSQYAPVITALNDGGYTVMWSSWIQDGSEDGIYLQQYNSSGLKVGTEQQVNSYTNSYQYAQVITALNGGGYVVAWESYMQDGSDYGIYLQQYSSSGLKVGTEQQVNSYTNSDQSMPAITALNDGGYTVAWTSYGQDGSSYGIYLQQYNSSGEKVGVAVEPEVEFTLYSSEVLNGNLDYIQDPDGDALRYSANATNGIFTIDGTGHWSYDPNDDFSREEQVVVKVDDGRGGVLYHTLTFNVLSPAYAAPIVLDLNHNGITSTTLATSNAYFDYDGDGNREHTAWMEAGDAQLVTDINQDGIINDGSEVFGEHTRLPDGTLAKNGYEALAQHDTNGDRVINSKDEAFGNLLLWRDLNQNGKSEDGELTNIQLGGVTDIMLDGENGITFKQSSENGNIILNQTNYLSKDGTGIVRDVGFAYDPFDTITNNDTLNKQQYGSVLSGADGADTYMYSLGDGKVVIDDNGDGNDTIVLDSPIVKDQLIVKWESNSNDLLIGIKENIYDISAFSALQNQIRIKNFFNESGSIENIQFSDSRTLSKSDLYDILVNTRDIKNLTARTLEADGVLIGGTFNDLLYGTDGQEELQGLEGNDFLKGLSGGDLLIGGEGDDVLQGGFGDDTLEGDAGDDVYIFEKGDGRDIITDFLGNDTIMFGDGISREEVLFEVGGNDLYLRFAYDLNLPLKERDSIQITNYKDHGFEIENLEFSNGETFSIARLIQINTNKAPEALIVSTHTLQDTRVTIGEVEATDIDGDILTYTISTAATHGVLSIDETGTWSYAATDGYMGSDSAVIMIDDGNRGVITQTLNFEVNVSAPTLADATSNLLEDNTSNGAFNVVNPIGGILTYEVLTATVNGDFSVDADGNWNYNPSQDYNGSDAVIVKVTNEYGLSTTSTLSFEIEAVNDAPVTTETEAFILQDVREQAGEVEATDVDGDTLTFSVTTAAQHGTLSIDETGAWTYSVDGYYIGEDSAVITVDDGNGGTVTKTLTFDARVTTPSLADATANLLEDNPSNGIFNVTNPIGGVLTYEVLTSTANGDFSVDADGNWNYNPSQDYNGSDAVIVKVTNEYGLSTTSTLSFEIEAVNDAPIVALEGEAFTLINIRDIDGKIEANDVDGDTLTYTVDTQAANGVVTIDSEGNWHYKAEGSFNGENNATILIDDGNGATVRSTLNFTVDGYIYEGGDLVITDNGEDTLVMNEITQTSLSFAKDGNNMTISVKDQGLITLTDYFTNVDSGVQTITTANGDINLGKDIIKNADESWWRGRMIADEDMKNLIIGNKHRDYLIGSNNSDILFSGDNNDMLQGLGGDDLLIAGKRNDRLYAGDGNDTVYGDSGNDKLYGEAGNDMLIGGDGNDTIFGGDGNDFLFGGLGSDKLEGARGDDTYFFEIGNQKPTIDDYEGQGKKSENAGYDTVKFGEGIYKEDISFIMKHGDLFFQYGDKDTIEIKNQDEISRQIEKFELADGSFLTNEDVDMVIQQLNAYSTDKKGMHKIDNETIRNNTEMMNIVSSAWQA